ncbi:MAG: monofunctional biosynthetic peptidoglycan transglycosylase [Vicinamibacterales bacterium]
MSNLILPAQAAATVPHWVNNVRSSPQGPLGMAALLMRRVHRLVSVSLTIGLVVHLGVRRLRSGLRTACLLDWCASAVLAFALLIAGHRWIRPRWSINILCARFHIRVDDPPPEAVEQIWVDLNSISAPMQLAVLTSEDAYFFWHFGFNPVEIWRAWRYNRFQRGPGVNRRGGSTISQQVAKNLFLAPTQSFARKVLEAWITLFIEGLWPKRRILEVYLNIVHFGDGAFGVEAASLRFFGHSASTLTDNEAALLTAALRRPYLYRVANPSPYMKEKQRDILQRMLWCGEGMLLQLDGR